MVEILDVTVVIIGKQKRTEMKSERREKRKKRRVSEWPVHGKGIFKLLELIIKRNESKHTDADIQSARTTNKRS